MFHQHRMQKLPLRAQESKLSDDGGDFLPATNLLSQQMISLGDQDGLGQAIAPVHNEAIRSLSSSQPSRGARMDSLEPLALGPGNSDHFVSSSPFTFSTGSQPSHDFEKVKGELLTK